MGTKGQDFSSPTEAYVAAGGEVDRFVSGSSPAMLTLQAIVGEIAPTNIPVLLVGEIGTGKQMFAHRIHQLSLKRHEPLAMITCASVNPESLGMELGLRTGQASKSPGDDKAIGTVFFDEVSELDGGCQRMLLYTLPDGDARPRGRGCYRRG